MIGEVMNFFVSSLSSLLQNNLFWFAKPIIWHCKTYHLGDQNKLFCCLSPMCQKLWLDGFYLVKDAFAVFFMLIAKCVKASAHQSVCCSVYGKCGKFLAESVRANEGE